MRGLFKAPHCPPQPSFTIYQLYLKSYGKYLDAVSAAHGKKTTALPKNKASTKTPGGVPVQQTQEDASFSKVGKKGKLVKHMKDGSTATSTPDVKPKMSSDKEKGSFIPKRVKSSETKSGKKTKTQKRRERRVRAKGKVKAAGKESARVSTATIKTNLIKKYDLELKLYKEKRLYDHNLRQVERQDQIERVSVVESFKVADGREELERIHFTASGEGSVKKHMRGVAVREAIAERRAGVAKRPQEISSYVDEGY